MRRVKIKTIQQMEDEGYEVNRASDGRFIDCFIPKHFTAEMEMRMPEDRMIDIEQASDEAYKWTTVGDWWHISKEMIYEDASQYIGEDE